MSRKVGNVPLQARSLRELGLVKISTGDYSQAQAELEQALQLFKAMDEANDEIHTLCNLSIVYTCMGDFFSAQRSAANALGRCEQAQLPFLRRVALGELGVALVELGQQDQGRECLFTSLEIARQIADRSQEIICLCRLGWLENRSGRLEEAMNYFRNGLSIAERLDSRAEQSQLYAGIAETHRLLGNTRLGYSLALKAQELAILHGRPSDQGLALQVLSNFERKM
jgi:tetratricopeptide (TPR) repeat protein